MKQTTLRNDRFRIALDYLYENGYVVDQRELSTKTGINEASISRILNNKVREPSETTLRKLNQAFDNMFNMQFFRGLSDDMLAKSNTQKEQTEQIPSWANNLIDIMSKQIAENEALHRQLTDALAQVNSLRAELVTAIRGKYPIQLSGDLLAADPRPTRDHS